MHDVKGSQVSLKFHRVRLRYGKTIIPNKLNHKPQANARGVQRKNKIRLKYFTVKGSTWEACRRTVMLPIEANFTTKILHSIKVTVQ